MGEKIVLVEISRRNVALFYYKGSGARTFEPYDSNGPVPLALCWRNGELLVGYAAKDDYDKQCQDAFFDLFDLINKRSKCHSIMASQFVPVVIERNLDEMCRREFESYHGFEEIKSQLDVILLYDTDISQEEQNKVNKVLEQEHFAGFWPICQSSMAVKYFLEKEKHDWRLEENAFVVSSNNKDLSIKCFSLANGELLYEKRFEGKGRDPRFDSQLDEMWLDVSGRGDQLDRNLVWPQLENRLERFLASKESELYSLRLSNGKDYDVYLNRSVYDSRSSASPQSLMSLFDSVVEEVNGLEYETTGIILQSFTSKNKYFRDALREFAPVSDENDEDRSKIRNQILRDILDDKFVPFSGRVHDEEENVPEVVEAEVEADAEPIIASGQETANVSSQPQNTTDLRRRFCLKHSIETKGKFFNKKKYLSVTVEVLDDKALPFDCMFTIDKNNYKTYKPEYSFCEECKKGEKGKLKFGPYELPISKIGPADILYAHIWPADKKQTPNIFLKNHLTIKI